MNFVSATEANPDCSRRPEGRVGNRRAGFDLDLDGIVIYSVAMFQN